MAEQLDKRAHQLAEEKRRSYNDALAHAKPDITRDGLPKMKACEY